MGVALRRDGDAAAPPMVVVVRQAVRQANGQIESKRTFLAKRQVAYNVWNQECEKENLMAARAKRRAEQLNLRI